MPEIRRLADWRGAYDPLNTFAVIPLLMLCPIGVFAIRRRHTLKGSRFSIIAVTWVAGFTYALVIATARGALVAGLYAGAQFVLPIVVAFWILTRPESLEVCQKRFARWLLAFAAVAGFYGIVQFVTAPPWDTAWMQSLGAGSFGTPAPLEIRVFGVLNSPGTYALFLGAVLLFNLPFLSPRRWEDVVAILLIVLGLLLSFVRSGWAAVLVGILVFLLFSPRRLTPILSLIFVALICAAGAAAFDSLVPSSEFGARLATRFATFSAIEDDASAGDRKETGATTLGRAIQQPIGAGLGLTGGGSKLEPTISALAGAPAGDIDNGFVSRYFEMGVPGFCAFLVACGLSVASTYFAHRRFAIAGNVRLMQMSAGCFATQIAVILLNLSGDDQQGILAIIFFITIAVPLVNRKASAAMICDAQRHPSRALCI